MMDTLRARHRTMGPMLRTAMVACLLTLVACHSGTEPDGTGTSGLIVARDVQIPIGDPPSIHVKQDAAAPCGVIYLIRSSTTVRRRTSSGSVVSASYADLLVGVRVKIWAQVVLDSCPGQSSADMVEIQP